MTGSEGPGQLRAGGPELPQAAGRTLEGPEPYRSPIEFGMETGLRSGEICALRLPDIDQLNRRMLVRRTWSGKRLEERTKGRRADWVPLSDRAWEVIAARLTKSDTTAFLFQYPKARPGQGFPAQGAQTDVAPVLGH